MKNYQGEQFLKTLTKRKIVSVNTLETNKNLKDIEAQSNCQTLNNFSNRYKVLELQNRERQNVSFFNKELLKNKKKR